MTLLSQSHGILWLSLLRKAWTYKHYISTHIVLNTVHRKGIRELGHDGFEILHGEKWRLQAFLDSNHQVKA